MEERGEGGREGRQWKRGGERRRVGEESEREGKRVKERGRE